MDVSSTTHYFRCSRSLTHYLHTTLSDNSDSYLEAESPESTSDESSETSSQSDPSEDLDRHLSADQEWHVRHPPIPVPQNNSPFTSEDTAIAFYSCLQEIQKQEIVPSHYGVSEEEWPEVGVYGTFERIQRGRNNRHIDVELPFSVWWPRAVKWAQGLELMNILLLQEQAP